MQNPFSTTYSKLPEHTYISTLESGKIIENFSYDSPSEAVYKITGLRGSGKTVLLSRVQEEFCSEENKEKGWIVYTLNPSRDMLKQLAASLVKESFINDPTIVFSFFANKDTFVHLCGNNPCTYVKNRVNLRCNYKWYYALKQP